MVNLKILLAVLVVAITGYTSSTLAALNASVDRRVINMDESLELKLAIDQQILFGEPDFTGLSKDFKIASQNRQSRISIVNGRQESFTLWQLSLLPKRVGRLLIPSFQFKGETSDPLEIEVRTATAATNVDAPVFTEALLDKQSVFVQEQLLLTLRLYTTLSLNSFEMSNFSVSDARVIKVAENQYQKQIDDKQFTVVETRFAIFADRSGELRIPAMQYSGVARDRRDPFSTGWLNRGGKRLVFSTEEKTISVKPRPDNIALNDWLPAAKVTLYDRWSEGQTALTVGEPVTRTVTINAQGLTAAQLPPLEMGESKNIKIYQDQAQLEDNSDESGITGNRIESMAIVPTQAGTLTLPDIRVRWWDTAARRVREAVLPGKSLQVLPPANVTAELPPETLTVPESRATTTKESASESKHSNILVTGLWVSNILALGLALAFAGLWWRSRSTKILTTTATDATVPAKSHFKAIRAAAANRDYAHLREAIIAWARTHWADPHIHTLHQVAERTQSAALAALFKQIDKCLFAAEADATMQPDVTALVAQLEEIQRGTSSPNKPPAKQLPPLYPEVKDHQS